MTVLHLLKTAVGATWALRQIRELLRHGVQVHVAMPSGPLEAEYRSAGAVVHVLDCDFPAGRPWCARAVCRKLRSLVDRVRPDLIHSHFVGTTVTMRLALRAGYPVPRVFQVPGPLHLEHPLFRRLELALAAPCDYWIGSCEWTCAAYRSAGVAADRVFLSYYGVDTRRLVQRQRDRLAALVPGGTAARVVGMVAYMYAPKRYLGQRVGLKGHEDLIHALHICRRSLPELVGVFVGGAWNGAASYERRVVEYGLKSDPTRNIFLGTRSDITDLYAAFDVAVCPSHSENVGAALESLLMRVPTVATNVGGLPDLVRNGETGWLVPPHDPEALAAAILAALADRHRARELAENGHRLATALFDVRKTAGQVLSIYQRILSGSTIDEPRIAA